MNLSPFAFATVDFSLVTNVVFIVGEITIIVLVGLFLLAVLLVTISLYSIRQGRMVFPVFLKAGFAAVEGLSKAIFRLFGLEDREMQTFFIQLHNSLSLKVFEVIPVAERAVFLPQCLRSATCPADLTPEGLRCVGCGRCTVSEALKTLEKLGYRLFIVPGSSFIKRMVKKYRPRAIIGIGCLSEVKEGIDMADKIGLVAIGVVTLKEGCVETAVNWEDVFAVAMLGIDPDTLPEEIRNSPWLHPADHF